MSGRLVVSLHDVTPATFGACLEVVDTLVAMGIPRLGLLVIPDAPDQPLLPGHELADWLRTQQAAGHELVQHGYTHRRDPDAPLSLAAALGNAVLARGAGEFLGLDTAAAAARLRAGRQRLAACGLQVDGFVAPAWLYSRAAAVAVAALGFRFLETHTRLRDLVRGRDHWGVAISNRPGPWAGDALARMVNERLVRFHRHRRVLRLAVHPADLSFHRPFEHTRRLLAALLGAGWQPAVCADILNEAA